MQGLWRNNFEDSQFCPSPARLCFNGNLSGGTGDRRGQGHIELAFRSLPAGWHDTPPGGLYAVDFVGKRSEYRLPGATGLDQEVIVDRLISIDEVEAPPPQPSKAEMVQDWKACEAAKTCIPNWNEINAMDEAQMKKAHIEGYLKECGGKQICMPNSQVPRSK